MVRVAILGATGYTALELIRLLLRHPHAEITALTSRQSGNPHIATVHPSLAGRIDLTLENLEPAAIAARAECVFSCLPHAASAEVVSRLVETGVRVVDFSADYRLNDAATYAEWYGHGHPDAQRLGHVPYGLPEYFGELVRDAALVANPGCFPTSAIMPIAPLLLHDWIDPQDIVVDSKTGVSGAGRTPKLTTHYPECNESVSAYNVGRHRHTPEMEQILERICGRRVEVLFTPHLIPMDRGMLSACYLRPLRPANEGELLALLRAHYHGKPFVRVVDHLPATKDSAGTNFCDITVRVVKGRILAICGIDNLGKGASGAAVQNFNWMFGFPETTAL